MNAHSQFSASSTQEARLRIERWSRCIVRLALMLTLTAAVPVSQAQVYPARPIRVIVASSPGSGPDIVARLLGAPLTETWGQPVIVDARPGASGIIGTQIAARAAADGYTLAIVTTQQAIVSAMNDKLPYDLVKDFEPISLLMSSPFLLVVHPAVPARSLAELIAHVKGHRGVLRYGSAGTGSPPHLSMELLRSMTGMDLQHVPYKGVTPAMQDTIAGEVHMLISVLPAVLPFIRSGRLRAVGITSATRSSIAPDIPPIAETVAGYEYIGWAALVTPAGTPAPVIGKLSSGTVSAFKSPAVRARLAEMGAESIGGSVQEMTGYIPAQVDRMRSIIKASGATSGR